MSLKKEVPIEYLSFIFYDCWLESSTFSLWLLHLTAVPPELEELSFRIVFPWTLAAEMSGKSFLYHPCFSLF